MSTSLRQTSPKIDGILTALRGRLVRLVWVHGLGTVIAVAAGWFLFAFLADWLLHVPAPVRLLHTAIGVGLPIYFFRREISSHLGRVPGPAGLAQLLERKHPEASDLLVSAVQLAPEIDSEESSATPGRKELLKGLVNRAEEASAGWQVDDALDATLPKRRALYGALATGAVVTLGATQPGLVGIFLQRTLGAGVSWPQETQLTLEIPLADELATREEIYSDDGERVTGLRLAVARGTDVPVVVKADGVVPDEVTLHFASGKRVRVPAGGRGLFRTPITSVQEDLEFWVTGGDDLDGEPRVQLEVLQPPDIGGLAIAVTPPAYSGLPQRMEPGPDVEVLAGSQVEIWVRPDPANAVGLVRLLPQDITMDLEASVFPSMDGDGEAEGSAAALAFQMNATESVRYRFELRDSSGLPNPDPGLYAIQVREDRRPDLLLLAPGRAEVPVVAGGALPLRVRLDDDFGLGRVAWTVRAEGTDQAEAALREEQLTLRNLEDGRRAVAITRLEVDQLTGEGAPAEATVLVLQVQAMDNREPEPGLALSAPVRLRIVSADDLQRRLQDDLARAGEQATRLQKLEEERLLRAKELLAAMTSDELEESGEVSPLLSGLRRIEGDARALARNLAATAESLLYARLDERALPLLEALDQSFSTITDRSFHPEPWRNLESEYSAGNLGQAGLAGQLVEIVGLALRISEEEGPESTRTMQEAAQQSDLQAVRDSLQASIASQERVLATTDRLLELLAEWDNFNSVLGQARAILNRQKNLTERTRQHAKTK